MNERTYRLLQGGFILLGLILESDAVIYFFIGLSLFEGLTGLRVPILVSKARWGSKFEINGGEAVAVSIGFEAERMMRLTIAMLLAMSYVGFPEETWFFPWFLGVMLIMIGLTAICPMVIFYRWMGFR